MDTVALVDRMVDSYNRHDIDALAACYVAGARVNGGGWPEDIDVTSWLAGLSAIVSSFPDLQLRPHNLVADGRMAMLETRMTGTNTGPFVLGEIDRLILGTQAETLPATGRAMDITGTVVLEVADDRVTAERHYWPFAQVFVQLGLVGSPRPS